MKRKINSHFFLIATILLGCISTIGCAQPIELNEGDILENQTIDRMVIIKGDNITIRNCVFDLKDKENPKKSCIKVPASLTVTRNITIENCTFKRMLQSHIHAIDAVNWTINNCHFIDTDSSKEWHGQAISLNTTKNCKITNTIFEKIEGTGVIVFHYKASDYLIENCLFVDCRVSNGVICSLTRSKGGKNVKVKNCTFLRCNQGSKSARCGIEFPHTKEYKSEGNIVTNCVWSDSGAVTWGWTARENNTVSNSALKKRQIENHGPGLQIISDLKIDPKTYAIVDPRIKDRGYKPVERKKKEK